MGFPVLKLIHKEPSKRANLFLIGGGMISAPRPGAIRKALRIAKETGLDLYVPCLFSFKLKNRSTIIIYYETALACISDPYCRSDPHRGIDPVSHQIPRISREYIYRLVLPLSGGSQPPVDNAPFDIIADGL